MRNDNASHKRQSALLYNFGIQAEWIDRPRMGSLRYVE